MVSLMFKWLMPLLLFMFPGAASDHLVVSSHPLYISVTEVNHNAADRNLEISCKIFIDDFESTLKKAYNTQVDLFKTGDKSNTDQLVANYIKKHLLIRLDDKLVMIEYVGHEIEKESGSVWSYFQVSNTPAPKKIEFSNTLLYDSYDKEINIMHVSVGGIRKSSRVNYPEEKVKFEF